MSKGTVSRRRKQRKRKRQQRRTANNDGLQDGAAPTTDPVSDASPTEDTRTPVMEMFSNVLRTVSFFPMVFVVVVFSVLHFLEGSLPEWAKPFAENDVPILTVTAGNAAIKAILMRWDKARGWGSFALLIAALATYLAGYRSIDQDPVSVSILTSLLICMVPAIFADPIAKGTVRTFKGVARFVLSPSGRILVMITAFVVLVTYNQMRNDDYIVNWLLIPLSVITAVLIAIVLTWLAFANTPRLFRIVRRLARRVKRKHQKRRGHRKQKYDPNFID